MADIKSPEERSRNMAKIRSSGTKPEEYVRKLLHSRGFRYRKNVRHIPGDPDAWFTKYNTALFIHGCFWHRHEGCKYAYMPKSRVDFWAAKFQKNIERDSVVREQLLADGIKIAIIWECTVKRMVKSESFRDEIIDRLEVFIKSDARTIEL